jgi:glyoxylase-like metal-dependent hydrolase (beta-lactamase superfamily II)
MSTRFLNCASMDPWFPRWHVGALCLLVDTDQGPVLVDTGVGLHDHEAPSALVRFFALDLGMRRAPEETAVRQLARLGCAPESVRHIVLTHLHFDHAGGLPDFPWAAVHVHRVEHATLARPRTWLEALAHDRMDFAHRPNWVLHESPTEKWFDFDAIPLPFSPEMFLIPLFGHTSGHCGVAIRHEAGWLFQCADALPTNAQYDLAPRWLRRMILGAHGPRLAAFAAAHPEVKMLAGHMWRSFF